MSSVKVAITMDRETLSRVDGLVEKNVFPNRSRAIQTAVAEKLARMERSRLASECTKLDPKQEKALRATLSKSKKNSVRRRSRAASALRTWCYST